MEELIYSLVCLVPVVLSIWKKAYLNNKLAPFVLFIVQSFLVEMAMIFTSINGINNHWLVNWTLLVEVFILGYMFFVWNDSRYYRYALIASLGAFFLIWLYQVLSFGLGQMSSLTLVPEHFFVVVFTGLFLLRFIRLTDGAPLRDSQFWIASGLLVFFSSDLIISSAVEMLYSAKKPSWYDDYYNILSLGFNYLSYLLYSVAFTWYTPKKN